MSKLNKKKFVIRFAPSSSLNPLRVQLHFISQFMQNAEFFSFLANILVWT